MRFGKPVFMSNNTSLPEIGGSHAFYWEHYGPEYMAEVLKKGLLVYESDKKRLSNMYVAHAKSFDWKDSANQYLEVYQSVLK